MRVRRARLRDSSSGSPHTQRVVSVRFQMCSSKNPAQLIWVVLTGSPSCVPLCMLPARRCLALGLDYADSDRVREGHRHTGHCSFPLIFAVLRRVLFSRLFYPIGSLETRTRPLRPVTPRGLRWALSTPYTQRTRQRTCCVCRCCLCRTHTHKRKLPRGRPHVCVCACAHIPLGPPLGAV